MSDNSARTGVEGGPPECTNADESGSLVRLENRLARHNAWRAKMLHEIQNYSGWLERRHKLNSATSETLKETRQSLENDRITIALVGEYSRGKTELINAIFFADYNRRLLPSTPGRTTMCTTEILYNNDEDPSLRLLPIETRQSNQPMSELNLNRELWTKFLLDVDSAADMTEALMELSRTKQVTRQEAKELGFRINRETIDPDGKVQIPVWRHAIVNYPHPLLKQGLVILDTPGLNALGSEPELTLRMLPNAHAVIFVLAADTGVTHTDLQIWKNHVQISSKGIQSGRLATLNKIDTLWDELLTAEEIEANIQRQVAETARLLEVPKENVLAVSAAKGLVGKIKNDHRLLQRTGLLALEKKLSIDIVNAKQEILRDRVIDLIGTLVESDCNILISRSNERRKEFVELTSMKGKGHDVLLASIAKLQEQKLVFEVEVESFRATRRMLSQQSRLLGEMLSLDKYDILCAETREAMSKCLTTAGMKSDMSALFTELTETFKRVEAQSEKVRGLITHSYNKFHKEHGLPKMLPMKFSMDRYTGKLADLIAEAKAYRDSRSVLVTSRTGIINYFFDNITVRVRVLLSECDAAAQHWALSVLNPIHDQLHEHRYVITQRLKNLNALKDSQLDLEGRLKFVSKAIEQLDRDLVEVQRIAQVVTGRALQATTTASSSNNENKEITTRQRKVLAGA